LIVRASGELTFTSKAPPDSVPFPPLATIAESYVLTDVKPELK
jgi:hypothetical protein